MSERVKVPNNSYKAGGCILDRDGLSVWDDLGQDFHYASCSSSCCRIISPVDSLSSVKRPLGQSLSAFILFRTHK